MSNASDPLASSKVAADGADLQNEGIPAALQAPPGPPPKEPEGQGSGKRAQGPGKPPGSSPGAKGATASPEPPLPPPGAPPKPVDVFELEEKIKLSIRGQFVTLAKGKRISEATHGPGVIDRLRDAGAKMHKVVG